MPKPDHPKMTVTLVCPPHPDIRAPAESRFRSALKELKRGYGLVAYWPTSDEEALPPPESTPDSPRTAEGPSRASGGLPAVADPGWFGEDDLPRPSAELPAAPAVQSQEHP